MRCAVSTHAACHACQRIATLRAAALHLVLSASFAHPACNSCRHLLADSVDSSYVMLPVYCAAAMSCLPSPSPKHMSSDLILLHECTSHAPLACLGMVQNIKTMPWPMPTCKDLIVIL
ncbi:unnamed protein product [Prunus brigantina]